MLNPLVDNFIGPFTTFYPAVLFSAWFSGFRATVLCTLLSTTVAGYFFTNPPRSFRMPDPVEQTRLLTFLIAGFGVAFLSRSKEKALKQVDEERLRRREAEFEERKQRQRFQTTLVSIGDGVIAADADGNVSFMNGRGIDWLEARGGFRQASRDGFRNR
jgi:K+-sensing histidine kinase KdpD